MEVLIIDDEVGIANSIGDFLEDYDIYTRIAQNCP